MTLLRDVMRLVRSWWTVDRIRVSPEESRLLRLGPGSVVRIGGRSGIVTRRSASDSRHDPRVEYQIDHEQGRATLQVRPLTASGLDVQWLESGRRVTLRAGDIQIYGIRDGGITG